MTAEPNNITNLDDERLIREGEAAVDGYNKDIYSARKRIMPMARGLAAAKRKYPANQDFGDWLQTSSYREVGADDRAALIHIGEHDAWAERFMRTTSLMSPQTIWDAIRDLLPPSSYDTKTAPEAPPAPNPSPANAPAAKPDNPPENKPAQPKVPAKPLTDRSAFHNAPRAEEIAAVYQNKKVRSALSRIWRERGGKQVWDLIVTALDGGLLVPNNFQSDDPSIALLFPLMPVGISRQYDIMNQRQRPYIRDVLLPAMIATRDKLIADPDRMREIIAGYERDQRNKQQQSVVAEKLVVAVKAMSSAEQELVMFGQTVWPRIGINQGEYDYDQVRAAIWTFRDLESWNQLAKESPESHARRIRNLFRYPGEYLQRADRDNRMARIFGLIVWFSHLMEKNPTAECRWPPYPHVEGQW